jgi:hypothetical protein
VKVEIGGGITFHIWLKLRGAVSVGGRIIGITPRVAIVAFHVRIVSAPAEVEIEESAAFFDGLIARSDILSLIAKWIGIFNVTATAIILPIAAPNAGAHMIIVQFITYRALHGALAPRNGVRAPASSQF